MTSSDVARLRAPKQLMEDRLRVTRFLALEPGMGPEAFIARRYSDNQVSILALGSMPSLKDDRALETTGLETPYRRVYATERFFRKLRRRRHSERGIEPKPGQSPPRSADGDERPPRCAKRREADLV